MHRTNAFILPESLNGMGMCRFVCKPPKTQEDLTKVLQSLPEGLSYAYNVGAADVFPTKSGKENAAVHLMARWDAQPDSSFFLCDDDNDLGSPLP